MSFNTTHRELQDMYDKIMGITPKFLVECTLELIKDIERNRTNRVKIWLAHPMSRWFDVEMLFKAAYKADRPEMLQLFKERGFHPPIDSVSSMLNYFCLKVAKELFRLYPEVEFTVDDLENCLTFGGRQMLFTLMNGQNVDHVKYLAQAVLKDNLELVKMILPYCDSKKVMTTTFFELDYASPLTYTLKRGSYDMVKILAERGDLNQVCFCLGNRTPLEYAVDKADIRSIKILLECGASQEANPDVVSTAVDNCNIEIIQLFIDHGFDCNMSSCPCNIPVYLAAINYRDDILDLLVENGANVNLGDIYPSNHAAQHGQLYQLVKQERFEAFKMLVSRGADMTAVASRRRHELMVEVISTGQMEFFDYMLKSGYPVDGVNTPILITAVTAKNTEMVRKLLDHGATADAVNANGESALHIACQYHLDKTIQVLNEHGANPYLIDSSGNTPFTLAKDLIVRYFVPPSIPTPPPMPGKKSDVSYDDIREEILALNKKLDAIRDQLVRLEAI